MKTKSASNWSVSQSEEHYGFKRWGANHFSVDSEGFVQVQPLSDGRTIRLMDVVDEATSMGLKAPLVIRIGDNNAKVEVGKGFISTVVKKADAS